MRSSKVIMHWCFVAGFALAIFFPFFQSSFALLPEPALKGGKQQIVKPSLQFSNIAAFPKQFEEYFNDTFGFRGVLVQEYNRFKVFLSKATPLPTSTVNTIIIGKQGWLYLKAETAHDGIIVKDFQGEMVYSEEDLAEIEDKIGGQFRRLNLYGIPSVLVIVPSKLTIYPEYLPDNIQKGASTRLSQLIEYFDQHSTMKLLDLRGPLVKGKSLFPTYYASDTHWTNYGSFLAYQAIMRELAKKQPDREELIPYEFSDFEVKLNSMPEGDLTVMLGLGPNDYDERITLSLKPERSKKNKLESVMLFHDSFGERFVSYLKLHFKEVELVKSGTLDEFRIKSQKPDAVILEIAERYQGVLKTGRSFS